MSKRCLIMAGGTGGHVFPGLAVAHALSAKGWDVHWLGTAERMEAQVVPQQGIPIHFIHVQGLRGKGLSARLGGIIALGRGLKEAFSLMGTLKPDLVIGFGGYASGPGGAAAWLRRIPLIIHEQNAAAGMTNRLLGKLARRILLGFDDARGGFKRAATKCLTIGNPVRKEITALAAKTETHSPLRMLVIGGSLGAQALNQTVPMVCSNLYGLTIRHQAGKGNAESVKQAYASGSVDVQVSEFIDDMAAAYEWADFIVCRAGALTVAEVAAAGLPAVFVPLPHAVDDHQTKNALSLVNVGAAKMLSQNDMAEELGPILESWLRQPQACLAMGHKARQAARTEATEHVVEQCHLLMGNKHS
ncbi:undecaprenyldiphospho-muramoylpentapeptide beta-N-acetylglucosaminyltransferase [Alteromonas sp. C1M14]|uniref:undecaprenyldiphospho-muramoylpentapeptide beta-N-acetylglucosaminyltransferase n=1 Tax=Alteromonas sp. C1M14 TaxID=2841567 RepID=UPI001C0A5387|nr:undecaprenyldiphospho-muramoylpentapeptide beta-N-acetylglucosaminyltransferase [Alteromonas sp. C1M14]MBU2979415.1 undecaprenyldiphospho-muramoylpentapeptide beta-N-acetylglucosaminyltransferase [Alteromonas sp. C1M14]